MEKKKIFCISLERNLIFLHLGTRVDCIGARPQTALDPPSLKISDSKFYVSFDSTYFFFCGEFSHFTQCTFSKTTLLRNINFQFHRSLANDDISAETISTDIEVFEGGAKLQRPHYKTRVPSVPRTM